LLEKVVREIPLPIIAIGGLTLENIPRVMQAGVYGVAVISAVCCQKDPRKAARNLRKVLESAVMSERIKDIGEFALIGESMIY